MPATVKHVSRSESLRTARIGKCTRKSETRKKGPIAIKPIFRAVVADIVTTTSRCEVGEPEGIGDEVAGIGCALAGLLSGSTRYPRFGLLNASFARGIRKTLGTARRSDNLQIRCVGRTPAQRITR
jgi:hypothetical protein